MPTLIKYVQKNPAERISSLAMNSKKWGSIHEICFNFLPDFDGS